MTACTNSHYVAADVLAEARALFASDAAFRAMVVEVVRIVAEDCRQTCGQGLTFAEDGAATVSAAVVLVLARRRESGRG